MIIFLYGPDSYRRTKKLHEIMDEYKKKHSRFSVERFALHGEGRFDALKDFMQAQSLFDDFKLGIIAGGGVLTKDEQKEYKALLKECMQTKGAVLVIEEEKSPPKEFKFLTEKPVLVQEFPVISGATLQRFIDSEAKKRGMQLDRGARDLLARAYADDSWGLVTELEKLSLLDEKRVTLPVLQAHAHALMPVNVFSMIYEMRGAQRIGERLAILEELFSRSEDPAMIFNVMAVSSYADAAQKRRMADYDVAIKSGKLEYEEVLTDIVVRN